ncbi:WXG100 family type VII secretion target [Arthrobacter sp. 31Y]|uniref:WXG100 family type VII secretion target n=1 Tax=Arthrobacter sp. 31Y TaxID=1115632 RepID=UPI00046514E9|nr:hypothetical protein [Arthrobacter sp. 31Y]
MPFYGADVDQLKALSKALASGASLLTTRARELDSLITQGGHWQGQDAKRFASDWQGHLRPLLERTSRGIEEASKSVLTNADEQSSASAEGGGGSGSGSGGSGGSGTGSGNSGQGDSAKPANDATTKTTDPSQPTPEEILEQYKSVTRRPPIGRATGIR